MTRFLFTTAFLLGSLVIVWIGAGFLGTDILALSVTAIIGIVYVIGFIEQVNFRKATYSLNAALNQIPEKMAALDQWLIKLHPSLQNATRLRIEGERVALPGPVLTPYLVGLLVMLGLLGTFFGMVVTLKGAVLALEGTTELQAIREGLARPIEGLGIAFGTSVAGVAASAMLGLISTLNRRDRMLATGVLDRKIATDFRDFSLTHNRQETFKALQYQAKALPTVAEKLTVLATQLENMSGQLGDRLIGNQDEFHKSVADSYKELAKSVEVSLQNSLASSSQIASDNIKPIVEEAMTAIIRENQSNHAALQNASNDHLAQLQEQFKAFSESFTDTWKYGVAAQQDASQALVKDMKTGLANFNEHFSLATEKLINNVEGALNQWVEQQKVVDSQRLGEWNKCLNGSQENASHMINEATTSFVERINSLVEQQQNAFSQLSKEWQQTGEFTQRQQQQLSADLEKSTQQISDNAQQITQQLLEKVSGLVESSEALVNARINSEKHWLEEHASQMEKIAGNMTQQFSMLRDQEEARGAAAVERIGDLEKAVGEHLALLGAALEDPMTRLIETASETPKAAAEVIARLKEEISNNIERDNNLLEERARIMESVDHLLKSLEETSTGQRQAIEQLVTSSSDTLKDVSQHFADQVGGEVTKLNDASDQFTSSALEISSLGDTFNYAVELFSESNQKLIENLNRIEVAMDKSTARSDEQLAYYVAQAREIIDHSMMSQKEVFEELRQLNHKEEPAVEEVD